MIRAHVLPHKSVHQFILISYSRYTLELGCSSSALQTTERGEWSVQVSENNGVKLSYCTVHRECICCLLRGIMNKALYSLSSMLMTMTNRVLPQTVIGVRTGTSTLKMEVE
jgi:hypothetical protein